MKTHSAERQLMKNKLLAAVGMTALLSMGTGCLVVDGNGNGTQCYDDCYTVEVCEVYQDPWEIWEECWYETSCDQVCTETIIDNPPPPATGNQCFHDLDCSVATRCVGGFCIAPEPPARPGNAGLCQTCESSYDCYEDDALCIRLNVEQTTRDGEKICSRTCDRNDECPTGFECVNVSQEAGASAQCLPRAGANGRTCNAGVDLECVSARDCGLGESCVQNVCKGPASAECTRDSQCTGGKVCDNFTCKTPASANECTTRSDCSANEVCLDGECVAQSTSCVFNSECDNGKCVDGACVASCTTNAQCGTFEHCRQGLCEAVECRRTADCTTGNICLDATCVKSCTQSSQCGAGYVCSANNYCEPDPNVACRSNSECARHEICNAGSCETPCSCNQDCPVDQVCNTDAGTCFNPANPPAVSQCEDNCDCPSGQVCGTNKQCSTP